MENIYINLVRAFRLLVSLDSEVVSIVLLSFFVSLTATVLSSLCSIPLSLFLVLADFPGKRLIINVISSFMAVPAVAIGLVVYLLLTSQGPLGPLGLLYTPWAMVIAQSLLATPIITSLSIQTLKRMAYLVKETALSLGASERQVIATILREAKGSLAVTFLVGFCRLIGETGMTMMVGGNIRGTTRVMTTAIALETMKGNFELASALGLVLLAVAFTVNLLFQMVPTEKGRY